MRRLKMMLLWSSDVAILLLACGIAAGWFASTSYQIGLRRHAYRASGLRYPVGSVYYAGEMVWELQTDRVTLRAGRVWVSRSRMLCHRPQGQHVTADKWYCTPLRPEPSDRWNLSFGRTADGWRTFGCDYLRYCAPEEPRPVASTQGSALSSVSTAAAGQLAQRGALDTYALQVAAPCWLLLALTIAVGMPGLRQLRNAARARGRWVRGLCLRCGYDLRASSGRCPECGTPTSRRAPSLAGVRCCSRQ